MAAHYKLKEYGNNIPEAKRSDKVLRVRFLIKEIKAGRRAATRTAMLERLIGKESAAKWLE